MARQTEGAPWLSSSPPRLDTPPDQHRAPRRLPGLGGERGRTVGISVVIFVFTFLAYWLLGPTQTAYDFQLSQANNIIHGHLDMTEEYTHNFGVLERVLYDGQGFCLPLNDPRGPEYGQGIPDARYSADCKMYMQHALGPAFMLIPVVLVFGLSANQTLISALLGALTAVIVYAITRRFTSDARTQLALTAMAIFGTTLWYSAADGGVWFFAHTTAVMFLFAAIYATTSLRSPLLAGVFIGAAFMCRPSTLLAGFFPLVAMSHLWLVPGTGGSLLRRIRMRPLLAMAAGVAPFVVLTGLVNFLRFDNPFESGYGLSDQVHHLSLAYVYNHGVFDISYIPRHIPVVFEYLPIFSSQGSFVWPSWGGLALWVTAPALFLSLFVHLRQRTNAARLGALSLVLACGLMVVAALGNHLGLFTWSTADIRFGLHLAPFWVLIALAITLAVGLRDRLAIACWAAIVPIVLSDWMFAATGWAQFGYRYALDFMPFLWLLAVMAVPRLRGYHALLIGAAVLVNLWGVLWIFKFAPMQLFGWTWVGW